MNSTVHLYRPFVALGILIVIVVFSGCTFHVDGFLQRFGVTRPVSPLLAGAISVGAALLLVKIAGGTYVTVNVADGSARVSKYVTGFCVSAKSYRMDEIVSISIRTVHGTTAAEIEFTDGKRVSQLYYRRRDLERLNSLLGGRLVTEHTGERGRSK